MRSDGFTLVEVLVALTVLLIVIAGSTGVYVTGFRSNAKALQSTQASQILAGLSGEVTQHQITLDDGDSQIIVYEQGPSPQPIVVTPAPTSCSSYVEGNREHFCATVNSTSDFDPSISGTKVLASPMRHYSISVCWSIQGGTNCAEANTLY